MNCLALIVAVLVLVPSFAKAACPTGKAEVLNELTGEIRCISEGSLNTQILQASQAERQLKLQQEQRQRIRERKNLRRQMLNEQRRRDRAIRR